MNKIKYCEFCGDYTGLCNGLHLAVEKKYPTSTLGDGKGIDLSPLGKSKPLHIDEASRAVNFLQGKVLTIIEAIGLERSQEKAIKDLVKASVSDCHMALMGIAYPETRMMAEAEVEVTGVADEAINGELTNTGA